MWIHRCPTEKNQEKQAAMKIGEVAGLIWTVGWRNEHMVGIAVAVRSVAGKDRAVAVTVEAITLGATTTASLIGESKG